MDTLERCVVPEHRALKMEFPMRSQTQQSQQNDFAGAACLADEIPLLFSEILSCTTQREQNSEFPPLRLLPLLVRAVQQVGQGRVIFNSKQAEVDACYKVRRRYTNNQLEVKREKTAERPRSNYLDKQMKAGETSASSSRGFIVSR